MRRLGPECKTYICRIGQGKQSNCQLRDENDDNDGKELYGESGDL